MTKVINIKLIIPGYQVGLRVEPKMFQNVHIYHNHWSHTKNHLHKNGWRTRCAQARRSGPTNSRLVRAAAASQGNWSRSEVILPRGASTRLTIFEKQLFHRGTSSGVLLDLLTCLFNGQASEYVLPWKSLIDCPSLWKPRKETKKNNPCPSSRQAIWGILVSFPRIKMGPAFVLLESYSEKVIHGF